MLSHRGLPEHPDTAGGAAKLTMIKKRLPDRFFLAIHEDRMLGRHWGVRGLFGISRRLEFVTITRPRHGFYLEAAQFGVSVTTRDDGYGQYA
jgi:hypothetical protein